jgi:hypothetical protein
MQLILLHVPSWTARLSALPNTREDAQEIKYAVFKRSMDYRSTEWERKQSSSNLISLQAASNEEPGAEPFSFLPINNVNAHATTMHICVRSYL